MDILFPWRKQVVTDDGGGAGGGHFVSLVLPFFRREGYLLLRSRDVLTPRSLVSSICNN